MALASRVRAEVGRQRKEREREREREREISPERTKVWMEPRQKVSRKKVPVVYYLTRNGHLEHPHFMEVTLSSNDGLYLRDVINRLNFLRGKGMASLYSWSSKRSYKNGFVWHDLTEDDFIYPAHGTDYVLKGSELLSHFQNAVLSPRSQDTTATSATSTTSSSDKDILPVTSASRDDSDFSLIRRKKSHQWCSLDLGEYKVYKADYNADASHKAADAATQTDDKRQWRRALLREVGESIPAEMKNPEGDELGQEDISPPPSSSSPETLETLIKGDGSRIARQVPAENFDRTLGVCPSGRARASAVLINLISCGSISLKDHHVPSLVSNYRPSPRMSSGGGRTYAAAVAYKEAEGQSFPAVRMEDKEYFSGSLIEAKKKASDGYGEFSSLKRSSSYNADRSSKLDVAEKEREGVGAKCIPRKPRSSSMRKESDGVISRSAHGSKRITDAAVPQIS